MGDNLTGQYAACFKRYKAYIFQHMVRALVWILLDVLLFLGCMGSFIKIIIGDHLSGTKIIFSAVLLLFLLGFCVMWAFCMRDYFREIARLRSGQIIARTGTITEKSKNKYLISISIPGRNKKGRASTAFKYFLIPKKNRECDFAVGDQITVVYGATRIMQMNGFHSYRVTGAEPAYVLYAFSGDETEGIRNMECFSVE